MLPNILLETKITPTEKHFSDTSSKHYFPLSGSGHNNICEHSTCMVFYSAQPAQLPMVIILLPPSLQVSQENEANVPYTLSSLSTFHISEIL